VDDLLELDGHTLPKALRSRIVPPSLFPQRHLQADPVAVDLARLEGRLPDHPPEVLLRVKLTLGDDTLEDRPGTWVHMPTGLRHSIQAKTAAVMLLLRK
jgi:hypothetical protein